MAIIAVLNPHPGVGATTTALNLLAAIARRGQRPVLLFNRVQGHDLRLVANLFASREVIARGVRATPETLAEVLGEKLDELGTLLEHRQISVAKDFVLKSLSKLI